MVVKFCLTITSHVVIGFYKIRLKMHDGIEMVLQNVKHIPKLKTYLISLGTLGSNGYNFKAKVIVLRVAKGFFGDNERN